MKMSAYKFYQQICLYVELVNKTLTLVTLCMKAESSRSCSAKLP